MFSQNLGIETMNRGAKDLRGHVDLGAKVTLDHEKGGERVLVCRGEPGAEAGGEA